MSRKKPDMRPALAATLEVNPDEILGYKKYGEFYSVIMKDFRKYVDILPATIEETSEALKPSAYPESITPELEKIYDDPGNHLVRDVRIVAKALGVPNVSTLNKGALIEEIELIKAGNFIPYE